MRRVPFVRLALTVAVAVALQDGAVAQTAGALPTGGKVAAGSATIATVAPGQQRITQTSDRAIINWQGFSIGAGASVQFAQPSSSSVVLNRVTGGDASSILGSLSANGQVFLVNPNGIYFGRGVTLDVGGLVATTLAIKDGDFLAGRYSFSRDPSSPARAEVVNEGVITARPGGYVVLAGDYAANRGTVEASLGTVALASGNAMTLDVSGDKLINFAVNEKSVAALAGVDNAGQLLADGGRVIMTAATARNLAAATVNNTGLIQAQSVTEKDGAVYLSADGGTAQVSGTIDVSGRQAGRTGGSVRVLGDQVALGNTARIDATGDAGGGQVLIGGSAHGAGPEPNATATSIASGANINASALASGNGGNVVVWSDDRTDFQGAIAARGGAN
ncbi:MAG TPA: filamentous hemagglutinin N-terminal domain-containing protein, partial [Burkholderiales bacterium]|nr:filamentous hemagglutinin N-terminal domain-containing protein [Burkholderiales bacterium]